MPRGGFAAAGFAYDTKGLALVYVKAYTVHGLHILLLQREKASFYRVVDL